MERRGVPTSAGLDSKMTVEHYKFGVQNKRSMILLSPADIQRCHLCDALGGGGALGLMALVNWQSVIEP